MNTIKHQGKAQGEITSFTTLIVVVEIDLKCVIRVGKDRSALHTQILPKVRGTWAL